MAWYRQPRTQQELRLGPTRAKRNHLPTAWDDLKRSRERSWKVQRKTRYHRIAGMSPKQVQSWFKMKLEIHLERENKR